MHKVIIVDDERIIRIGIAQLIGWDKLGLELSGTYENGELAYRAIMNDPPDIVITDIKMPDMDGLQLIDLVHDQYPDIRFIILTGYDEFEFAHRAIRYGVKDYILKPCDETDITASLVRNKEELRQKENEDHLILQMKENWKKALPQVKERFLTEVIETNQYNPNDYARFRELFHIARPTLRLIMLRPEQESSLLERFALKNIAEEMMEVFDLSISTMYKGDILLLIGAAELEAVERTTKDVSEVFQRYYHKTISIAISDEGRFDALYALYMEAKKCMDYAFYLGEGSVITNRVVDYDLEEPALLWKQDYERIGLSVRTGHVDAVRSQVDQFFDRLAQRKFRIDIAKIYCLELLINIVRQCSSDEMDDYVPIITRLQEMLTLQQVQQAIMDVAVRIAGSRYDQTTRKYSTVVESVLTCIENELSNPNLSLKWIAKEMLYMNEDYLGRLFHRETGERFSQCLIRTRMEKAKQLIETSTEGKLYEISEAIGYGDKYHYFSLAFKKYTGWSPSEYKKMHDHHAAGSC